MPTQKDFFPFCIPRSSSFIKANSSLLYSVVPITKPQVIITANALRQRLAKNQLFRNSEARIAFFESLFRNETVIQLFLCFIARHNNLRLCLFTANLCSIGTFEKEKVATYNLTLHVLKVFFQRRKRWLQLRLTREWWPR